MIREVHYCWLNVFTTANPDDRWRSLLSTYLESDNIDVVVKHEVNNNNIIISVETVTKTPVNTTRKIRPWQAKREGCWVRSLLGEIGYGAINIMNTYL